MRSSKTSPRSSKRLLGCWCSWWTWCCCSRWCCLTWTSSPSSWRCSRAWTWCRATRRSSKCCGIQSTLALTSGLIKLNWSIYSETFTALNIYLNLLDFRHWTSTYRDQKSTIKRCKWKVDLFFKENFFYDSNNNDDDDGNVQGMDINCTAIFKTNPTDRGMCCTFNALAAEEIYRWSYHDDQDGGD